MANFTGVSGDDIFTGGSENDTLIGNGGNDTLSGGGGSDRLVGGAGEDFLDGGDGDDQLFSHIVDPNFNAYGSRGVSLDIYAEVDVLNGGAGDDYIFAGYGNFVDGGTYSSQGDRLFISFLGAPSGVQADFRVLQGGGTLTIGGATIKNITNIGYLEGSNFDDLLVPIDTYYPMGASVYGRGGNDHIIASYYSGWAGGGLYGGDGDDIVDARGAQYMPDIYGDAGNDILYAAYGWSKAYGGDGDDLIFTSASAWGGAGNDTITLSYGYYGTTADGEAGDDLIDGSAAGAITAAGGTGSDTIIGSAGNDVLASGAGPLPNSAASTWSTDNGSEVDLIEAGGGDDLISAGYGDSVDGGAGSDRLRLSLAGFGAGITFSTAGITSGGEVFVGGGSIKNIEDLDYLTGTAFADRLTLATQGSLLTVDAGDGDDVIIANGSSTKVFGGAGNDRFFSGVAGDIFDGGSGSDTVDYSNLGSAVSITLATGGSATGPGGDQLSNIESLTGTNFADTLTGNSSDNVLSGGAGNDTLNGGAGRDTLDGGTGNDSLRGGAGADILTGGSGADSFIGTASELNGDVITDFTLADRIVVLGASLPSFTYSLSGKVLSFTGGSLTLGQLPPGIISAKTVDGGVELSFVRQQYGYASGDLNGDGRDDILWRNASSALTSWKGEANGSFTANDSASYVAMSADWRAVATGDFNGDGRDDVVWRRDDGMLTTSFGTVEGGLAANAGLMASVPSNWTIAGVADFDGNGTDDLLWRDDINGTVTNWLATTAGGFAANNALSANVSTDWKIVGAGDFNGDGFGDLLAPQRRNGDKLARQWVGRVQCQSQPSGERSDRLADRGDWRL